MEKMQETKNGGWVWVSIIAALVLFLIVFGSCNPTKITQGENGGYYTEGIAQVTLSNQSDKAQTFLIGNYARVVPPWGKSKIRIEANTYKVEVAGKSQEIEFFTKHTNQVTYTEWKVKSK